MQREFELQLALVEVLLSTNGPATAEDIRATKRMQELREKLGNPGQLVSASMTAWKPKAEFKVLEESVPNHPPAQVQPALPSELDPGEVKSLPLRPSRDSNLTSGTERMQREFELQLTL